MDLALINRLVEKASKYGAQGFHVLGWIPPSTASSDPDGILITKLEETSSASQRLWYQ